MRHESTHFVRWPEGLLKSRCRVQDRGTKVLRKICVEPIKTWYTFLMRILVATLVLLAVVPAYGSIILFSGVTVLNPAPTSVIPPAETSDSTIFGFAEQQGVVLGSSVDAGITMPGTWTCCSGLPIGVIPAGETVNSYLLFASPVTAEGGNPPGRQFIGNITFTPGEQVVGILIGYAALANTDGTVGAPGTIYPPPGNPLGGMEPGDKVFLSANGQTVGVDFRVGVGNVDMIRILTSTPEPGEFILIGSGLLALGFCRRRLTASFRRR